MSAHTSRVHDLVSIPELAQPEVSLRVNTGLAANQSLEANFFSGILKGVAGRLGLVPPGMTDPLALARVGVSRQWATTLREAVQKMEGRELHVGLVAHDVLPPGLRLDYDPDSGTRGLDIMTPVLMPSLLSGLVGNIGGPKQPAILTQPASFEAGGGLGGHVGIPLKSEAPGPSCKVDLIPPMPASKEEVPKCEPSSHRKSQRDSPVLDVNPKDIAEIIVDDGDDLDLTIKEPQAVSTPVVEPTPRRKRSPDDQGSSLSPSKKCTTKEEGVSTPHQEEDLPKGVKLECKLLFLSEWLFAGFLRVRSVRWFGEWI